MPKEFIYPIYMSALALLTFILVPRKEIRRLAIYAIVFGGAVDVFALTFFSKILGMAEFLNFKPFGAFGLPFFVPISWVAYFTLFMYFMPQNKPWKYIYPVITSCLSLFFAYVLQALGIFRWNYSPILLLLLVYLPWQCGVAWFYLRSLEGATNKQGMPKRYLTVPIPTRKHEYKDKKIRFVKPKKL